MDDSDKERKIARALAAKKCTIFGCVEWPPSKEQENYPGGYFKGHCINCGKAIVVSHLNLERAQEVGNEVFIACRACAVLGMALLGKKAEFGGIIREGRLPRDDHN